MQPALKHHLGSSAFDQRFNPVENFIQTQLKGFNTVGFCMKGTKGTPGFANIGEIDNPVKNKTYFFFGKNNLSSHIRCQGKIVEVPGIKGRRILRGDSLTLIYFFFQAVIRKVSCHRFCRLSMVKKLSLETGFKKPISPAKDK
jgi:hypothetical protein